MNKISLTKKDIIKNLSEDIGFSKKLSKKIIEDFLSILLKNLSLNSLKLKNIGSFKIINKKERMGRNPKTNENFLIKSRKSLSFTASINLLNLLNKNR